MTERRDIGARLENWGRVYRPTRTIGVSATGAFCDQLEREANGEKPTAERRKVDEADAQVIERAMRLLSGRDRLLLKLCYVDQAEPHVVCRKLSLAHRPATVFVTAFRGAQAAVEWQLNNNQTREGQHETDGDAQRAWNELFANINDKGVVKQRLTEIRNINARAAQLRKLDIDGVRANYGHDAYDFSAYEQAAAPATPARGTSSNGWSIQRVN